MPLLQLPTNASEPYSVDGPFGCDLSNIFTTSHVLNMVIFLQRVPPEQFKGSPGALTTLDESDFVPNNPSTPLATVFSVCYGLIILLALIGNLLVLLVLLQRSGSRAVTDVFMASLALSDILIVTINMPLQLFTILHPEWTLGLGACKFKDYSQAVTVLSSVLMLVAIAIDRYLAICHPLRMRVLHNLPYVILVLVLVWVTSLCVSVPHILIASIDETKLVRDEAGQVKRFGKICMEDFRGAGMDKTLFNILTYVFYYVLPVVVIVLAYGAVARVLWMRAPLGDGTQDQACARMRQKRRLVRMLATVGALFVLCWFPFFTATLIRSFSRDARRVMGQHRLHAILQIVGYSNSVVNPIIYTFMSPKMRRSLRVLICGKGNSAIRRFGKRHACCYCLGGKPVEVNTARTNVSSANRSATECEPSAARPNKVLPLSDFHVESGRSDLPLNAKTKNNGNPETSQNQSPNNAQSSRVFVVTFSD